MSLHLCFLCNEYPPEAQKAILEFGDVARRRVVACFSLSLLPERDEAFYEHCVPSGSRR